MEARLGILIYVIIGSSCHGQERKEEGNVVEFVELLQTLYQLDYVPRFDVKAALATPPWRA
jgi:hypothetical protein